MLLNAVGNSCGKQRSWVTLHCSRCTHKMDELPRWISAGNIEKIKTILSEDPSMFCTRHYCSYYSYYSYNTADHVWQCEKQWASVRNLQFVPSKKHLLQKWSLERRSRRVYTLTIFSYQWIHQEEGILHSRFALFVSPDPAEWRYFLALCSHSARHVFCLFSR